MALYFISFALMLLGPVLGLSDSGLELAIWCYASAFVLAFCADLLIVFRSNIKAPWKGKAMCRGAHVLAMAATLQLIYYTLFKQRPNYEITLAVCLLLWLTSLVGCLGRPKFKVEDKHG
jgi:O-antigen/teichoic acid export membrane protein